MEIIYLDGDILVCVKPARVLSTDEPGVCRICCGRNWGIPRRMFVRFTGWTGWSAV